MQNPRFFPRVFGVRERRELGAKQGRRLYESAAACFCAKEACAKALGTGFAGLCLHDIQLLHEENGRPYLSLSGRAAELLGARTVSVSLTHTATIAGAVVILEGCLN